MCKFDNFNKNFGQIIQNPMNFKYPILMNSDSMDGEIQSY